MKRNGRWLHFGKLLRQAYMIARKVLRGTDGFIWSNYWLNKMRTLLKKGITMTHMKEGLYQCVIIMYTKANYIMRQLVWHHASLTIHYLHTEQLPYQLNSNSNTMYNLNHHLYCCVWTYSPLRCVLWQLDVLASPRTLFMYGYATLWCMFLAHSQRCFK